MENKHLLLVEDDEFLREIYSDTLKSAHYQFETAVDGEEAFEKIKQGTYDLILLDIILPKMTGLEVVKKLKEESFSFPSPIVFLSNIDNEAEMKEALQTGKGYLVKSQMTPGEFLEKVKIFLTN